MKVLIILNFILISYNFIISVYKGAIDIYNYYVQSVPITTKVEGSDLAHGKVYSIQHYVIKFVSDLRQVSHFLRVNQFPPPIKLTTTI